MFRQALFTAVLAVTSLVSAQNYSTSGPINVTASSVPYSTRQSWCITQTQTCPQICNGQVKSGMNQCDPNSLSYTCVCDSSSQPNISNYQQTLPSLICRQWVQDCVKAHPNDLTGQQGCLSVMCGNVTADSTTSGSGSGSSSSSSMSMASGMATASATASSSGSASSASSSAPAASSSSSSSGAIMSVAVNYGTGALVAGMLAVFGLAL